MPTPVRKFPCPLAMKPGTGSDRQATVVMKDGGYVNYWELSTPNTPNAFNIWDPVNQYEGEYTLGFNAYNDAKAGTVEVIPANEAGNLSTMSPALPMHQGVVRYKDWLNGYFPYKIAMTISRVCGFSGPIAPAIVTDVEDPSVGVTYRAACAPARILTPATTSDITWGIPEAMVFQILITDVQIETWLDARGYTGQLRALAKMFAVALRGYGMVLSAFGGTASLITDGDPGWRTLNIPPDLLGGLITRNRLQAVRPPTATYVKGGMGTREGNASTITA